MNQQHLLDALAELHRCGHEIVTAHQIAENMWPNARHNNANGQVFNLAAGVAGRMMERCKAVVRQADGRTWVIVPEYLPIARGGVPPTPGRDGPAPR